MAQHSSIVGGSTAKRVINCPGSVALVARMPPKPSSVYADTGTLLHNIIADILDTSAKPEDFLGMVHADVTFDQDLLERKLLPALAALNDIDAEREMEYAVESVVGFGELLPDVFGSADIVGRIGDTAYIVDWKFGDGVAVEVEENPQLMFYAAAAMRTDATKWAFEGAAKIELVIVQPPYVKRWETTPRRIQLFEKELIAAVKAAQQPDAPLAQGDWCRWCAGKAICPIMTGAADRALVSALKDLSIEHVPDYLKMADQLEGWIKEVRALAMQTLEAGLPVPGYKLVPKRGTRQWVDENKALEAMRAMGVNAMELTEMTILSPAKAEKVLKKHKLALPDDHVVSVSSGNTLASEDDPRPAVLQIGAQLSAALGKLV
ncbi:Protein of unknown function DUF2800 [uncultured Caudovirales phage]|uniref:Uncharacterized protein n=1 Tax=uncultured Caudovirales phage TaxID=2100421 RepID=A0A6J5TB23_9CAUD|nr:Protein of unknown function DUF2800 [uncultured Caudovirales phage]CAB5187403.1 Protein of unknown function DUF2800 [uncultured Caudovirales phage]